MGLTEKRSVFLSMTDKEIKVSILKKARSKIEHTANECETRKRYGDESTPVLWHSKGIRDACWTIDDLIEEIEKSQ